MVSTTAPLSARIVSSSGGVPPPGGEKNGSTPRTAITARKNSRTEPTYSKWEARNAASRSSVPEASSTASRTRSPSPSRSWAMHWFSRSSFPSK